MQLHRLLSAAVVQDLGLQWLPFQVLGLKMTQRELNHLIPALSVVHEMRQQQMRGAEDKPDGPPKEKVHPD